MFSPIDKMILRFSDKILISMPYGNNCFRVCLGACPDPITLSPLLSLIESDRFSWHSITIRDIQNKGINNILSLTVEKTNVIPVSDAINALKEMWESMGYDVEIDFGKNQTAKAISNKEKS